MVSDSRKGIQSVKSAGQLKLKGRVLFCLQGDNKRFKANKHTHTHTYKFTPENNTIKNKGEENSFFYRFQSCTCIFPMLLSCTYVVFFWDTRMSLPITFIKLVVSPCPFL